MIQHLTRRDETNRGNQKLEKGGFATGKEKMELNMDDKFLVRIKADDSQEAVG